ncbi:MAG: hypothetical protein KDB80_05590 [Planctomycetes bacterium]|nr:hypothetical protein [Planctomycetota bacterium]
MERVGNDLHIVFDDSSARYPITIDPVAQQAYFKASNPDADDEFGYAVAIDGDTAVVGSLAESSVATGIDGDASDNSAIRAGAAYVFVRSGSTWTQQAYLKASNTDAGDLFGSALAISGDTIVHPCSTASGKAANADAGDLFGNSVWIEGDRIVVGAPGEDSVASGIDGDSSDNSVAGSGAAYVFERAGSAWTQSSYVKASQPDVEDGFGFDVALAGEAIVVGANEEDSASGGVGGDVTDNGAPNSGAAYVFDLGASGCPGAEFPVVSDPVSATIGFSVMCPPMVQTCTGFTAVMFGECSPIDFPIDPPIGCGACSLLVVPSWGVVGDPLVVGPGLPIGFTFCVQCACIAGSCIDLSIGTEVVVGP